MPFSIKNRQILLILIASIISPINFIVLGNTMQSIPENANSNFTKIWSINSGVDFGDVIPTVGDLNGDGIPEILTVEKNGTVCSLLAIYGNNGSLMWKRNTQALRFGSPIVKDIEGDGILEIILPTQYLSFDRIEIFNGRTGDFIWAVTNQTSYDIQPCISDIDGDNVLDIVFASISDNGQLIAYNMVTKNKIWETKNETYISCNNVASLISSTLPEQNVVIVGYRGYIIGYYGGNGSLKWKFEFIGNCLDEIILVDCNNDGRVELLFGTDVGTMYCLDALTGEYKWGYFCGETDRIISSKYVSDIDFDGTFEVIVSLEGTALAILNGRTGEELRRIISSVGACKSITIGDIDNDDIIEIFLERNLQNKAIFTDPLGKKKIELDLSAEFPNGLVSISSMLYYDINADGYLEIIIQAQKLICFSTNSPKWKVSGLYPHNFGGITHLNEYKDSDFDGLSDQVEFMLGTNRLKNDTDEDGISDFAENQYLLDPFVNDANSDADGDGLSNILELQKGTSPRKKDTDGDGFNDNIDFDPLNKWMPLGLIIAISIVVIFIACCWKGMKLYKK